MTTPDVDEGARLTDYLLGRMRADDLARIEEQYLADPGFHEKLRAAERDLIDHYVRGELADTEAFEKHYLSSPRRREKVEFARALMQWSDRSPDVGAARNNGPWRPAWQVAAAVSIVVAGSWFALGRWMRSPGTESGTGNAVPGVVQPAAPNSPPPASQPSDGARPVAVATFVLIPSQTRASGETPALVIDASADVRLRLVLEAGDYASYRARIRTADGNEIWHVEQLSPTQSPAGRALVLIIPAARFADDDYTILVSGVTSGGEVDELSGYAFRVRMRR